MMHLHLGLPSPPGSMAIWPSFQSEGIHAMLVDHLFRASVMPSEFFSIHMSTLPAARPPLIAGRPVICHFVYCRTLKAHSLKHT